MFYISDLLCDLEWNATEFFNVVGDGSTSFASIAAVANMIEGNIKRTTSMESAAQQASGSLRLIVRGVETKLPDRCIRRQ